MSRSEKWSQREIAVLGYACRLPGASDPREFWDVLTSGTCTVSDGPEGRWDIERFLHTDQAPGYSYTFAGGYLNDVLGFDAGVFNVSPREGGQIDPQQRLLLEVVWEALEDAGLVPSSLRGEAVGVYVGASNVDYQSHSSMDLAAIQSHFISGNSLAIIANRVSYAFDWKGPSITIDAACASSFAALHQAMRALDDGEVDIAVVAGVNLLLSPAPFIGFSAARMLSPTGRCRPFSADADGYVRSEGLVAIVLTRLSDAKTKGDAVRSVLLASMMNSDGRTVGISLPSMEGQKQLLRQLYEDLGLSPNRLAFVEAHGTGTAVGDPIEAMAIGEAIGQARDVVLPIGSAKSNFGHLEPVSGLVGLLKASMALHERVLPKTLFLEELSPHIDFSGLNLQPVSQLLELEKGDPLYAGVCNFGFGGTNVHVVMRGATEEEAAGRERAAHAKVLLLSAQSEAALASLASSYADLLEHRPTEIRKFASAAAHHRERMEHRFAVPLENSAKVVQALRHVASGQEADTGNRGEAAVANGKVAFVFTGNGCQWPEMGQRAYSLNPVFRQHISVIDNLFEPLSGWSIRQMLEEKSLAERLGETQVAQPLIFAVQSSLVAALRAEGVVPAMVIGHSVGEVAAAESAGALALGDAVRLIHARSVLQERIRGQGRMAVVAMGEDDARSALARLDDGRISVAAINSQASVTLSGPGAALEALMATLRRERVPGIMMDLDYPFHSAALDPLQAAIGNGLEWLKPQAGAVPFISTVTGDLLGGRKLGSDYWWRNVRFPVLFAQGVLKAADMGATLFLEISPRPILLNAIGDVLRSANIDGEALASLTEEGGASDPVRDVALKLLVRGAAIDEEPLLGRLGPNTALPLYPWQHVRLGLPQTSERLKAFGSNFRVEPLRHPLLGARVADGSMEWRQVLDSRIVPYLADHKVDGAVIMPGAAYVEMLLAVGAEVYGEVSLCVRDLDIERPMVLADDGMREILVRFMPETATVEVWSRKRLSTEAWARHVRGKVRPAQKSVGTVPAGPGAVGRIVDNADAVYEASRNSGLDYGPSFRRVVSVVRDEDAFDVEFSSATLSTGAYNAVQLLDPTALDACLHGLLLLRSVELGEKKSYLPIRFRRVTLLKPREAVHSATVRKVAETDRSSTVDMALFDTDGELVALVEGVHLKVVVLSRRNADDRVLRLEEILVAPRRELSSDGDTAVTAFPAAANDVSNSWLLLQAFALSLVQSWLERMPGNGDYASGAVAEKALYLAEAFGLKGECERPDLPSPAAILAAFSERFPHAQAEILLAAHALAHFDSVIATDRPATLAASQVEQLEIELEPFVAIRQRIVDHVNAAVLASTPAPLAVLWAAPWNAGLWRGLLPFLRDGSIRLTLGTRDTALFDAFVARHGRGLSLLRSNLETELATFDLVVGTAATDESLAATRRLKENGRILIGSAMPHPVVDFLLAVAGITREPLVPDAEALSELLRSAALEYVVVDAGCGPFACLAVGKAGKSIGVAVGSRRLYAMGAHHNVAAQGALVVLGQQANIDLTFVDGLPQSEDLAEATDLIDVVDTRMAYANMRVALGRWLLQLVDRLTAMPERNERLRYWLMLGTSCDARESGIVAHTLGALARVAMNEFAGIDLRVLSFNEAMPAEAIAADLLVALAGTETELRLAQEGTYVPRFRRRGPRALKSASDGYRTLLLPKNGIAPGDLSWTLEPRIAPGAGELEIRVAHAGMNFRDLMIALGILDEDLLSGGLTHGAFGFECSGVVERIGEGVEGLQPGDEVMAFAANAFASHVTVAVPHVVRVPEGISLVEAATVPVAFSTAWYALEEVARIRPGERVLIHGAVGAVGMAAIQIARRRGAVIYATAGTASRRALAEALGAEKTFDSRSLAFVEAILAEGGVDVVLNSLAGDAMREGLRVLRPFGRFLELGKRDYLDDSAIRLRPFVHNLTYCGIDLDELLGHDPVRVNRVMTDLMACFADGSLRPLPYRMIAADEVPEALRLMRSAEHMGKLVVTPAQSATLAPDRDFQASPDGVHLVVGGTGGLGLATALWLLEQGATNVAVASRRGVVDHTASARIAALAKRGRTLHAYSLDVSESGAVDALMVLLAARFGAVRGIVHTAMVLNDGMLSNLSADALNVVLTPKVDGVLALDRVTRGLVLDYFVVYSSATTLIGSPGQGAYVVGNAFLEGVVRSRRSEGLPGLAIGWGAISDVGVLARDTDLMERLRRTTGVGGIKAEEALAELGRLLVAGETVPPVNFFAEMGHSLVAEKLPILATPAFAGLLGGSRAEANLDGEDNLTARLAASSREEASAILVDVISREIANILRLPPGAVNPRRPLGEMGMDSLMALELRLGLEQSCGIEMPIISIGGRTVEDLVQESLTLLHPSESVHADAFDSAESVVKLKAYGAKGEAVEESASSLRQLNQAGGRLT